MMPQCTTFRRHGDFEQVAGMFRIARGYLMYTPTSFCVLIPYAPQVQHKLNRVATASGSADPPVAMAALLDVMSRVHAKNAGRKDHEQVLRANAIPWHSLHVRRTHDMRRAFARLYQLI